jgi:hypothetical protein
MNIVIESSTYTPRDLEILFPNEQVICVRNMPLPSLLKTLKIYKSSNQAISAGRTGQIPHGYTELKASKKVTLYIWNPT